MQIGIIILNWNGQHNTFRCLESLEGARNSEIQTHTIVIDNGSSVDPGTELERRFPEVDYVRLDKNIGFAAGCNLGARRALASGADFVLFLNNDTVVQSNLLSSLIQSFTINQNLGLVSPLIRTTSNSAVIEFAGGYLNYALGRFKPSQLEAEETVLRKCDYASGCCLLINRKAVDEVGLFDEKFFAYFEDTDLSIRAAKKGFTVACRVDTSIAHIGSATTRSGSIQGTTSPMKHYLVARNRIMLIRKHAPFGSRLVFFGITQPLAAIYYLLGFTVRRRPNKARAFLLGIYDGLRSAPIREDFDRWL